MPILTARFCIEVPSPCLLQLPEGETPEVVTTYDSFHVVAKLVSADHWRSKTHGDTDWTTGLGELQIEVSRDEPDSPPSVIVTPDDGRDFTLQSDYLRPKKPEYQVAAREVANRILKFFQYSLFTPLVRQIPTWDSSLHNPTWFDTNGNIFKGDITITAEPITGRRGELGVRNIDS